MFTQGVKSALYDIFCTNSFKYLLTRGLAAYLFNQFYNQEGPPLEGKVRLSHQDIEWCFYVYELGKKVVSGGFLHPIV